MKGNTKIIVILIVLAAVWYFFLGGQATVAGMVSGAAVPTPTPAPTPITPGGAAPAPVPGAPAMSQPATVSQPAVVSQASPVSTVSQVITPTPVAINQNPAVFISTPTDAEVQGSAATVQPANPFGSYPAGFQSWANSLGPQNQAKLISALPSMTSTDINFINNMVVNNLWGQPSVAGQWNAFVKNYGFPVGGGFSNFK